MLKDRKEIGRIFSHKSSQYFRRNPLSGLWGGLFPDWHHAKKAMDHTNMEQVGGDMAPCVLGAMKLRGLVDESVTIVARRFKKRGADTRDIAHTRVITFWKK